MTAEKKKRKGSDIGVKVDFDPAYFYFVVKNEVYRVSKKHAIRNRKITDKVLLKKIRLYNAKLREKVGEIPIEVYGQKRIYCVKRNGQVADYGEIVGLFPNKSFRPLFGDVDA